LIELLVVIPVLLLFLSTIFPLLVSGIAINWLDERLWLRQFYPSRKILHLELEDAHGKNLIPLYFEQKDLEETTNLEKLSPLFPLFRNFFPGPIRIKEVLANHLEGNALVFEKASRSDEKLSRNLAILASTLLTESDAPLRIKNLTVVRIFPWKVGTLKNHDFGFFHLNLDALPKASH
jgi:hypothetical protein